MESILKFVVDLKILDISIGVMAVFAAALVGERIKALYFTYSMDVEAFMAKIFSYVEQDKVDEAITYCSANQKKPMAHVIKRILERSDRDDSAIDQSLDIAAAEVAPRITRNLGYLSMVSNVVTLIGLLGTVVGLIMSFKAVAFADPTQKQALLADGISLAMHATAMGLLVAIPTMVFYSFLHSKQSQLFSDIDRHSNRLIELLRSRSYDGFAAASAFPGITHEKSKVKVPPMTTKSA